MPIRDERRRLTWPWALVVSAVICAAPFGLLPLLLYRAPEAWMEPGLFVLLRVLCPVLSLVVPAFAARRGVPALLACLLPVGGYLLILLQGMVPWVPVIVVSLLLSVVSASIGQERRRRERRKV